MAGSSRPLDIPEAAALLEAGGRLIQVEVGGLPEAVAHWHPAPGAWCVREVLGHVIEAEQRGFANRIRTALEQEMPAFEAWSPPEVARGRGDCARATATLLAEFARLRQTSVRLVGGLDPAALGRTGRHPQVGHLSIGHLLHEWVHHDRNHIRQILANVQAFVWLSLGNAQRFSDS